ncbi:MAG: ABC transporter permease, partial [Opitutaceae bacterium]
MTGDAGLPGGTSLAIVLPVMIAIGLAAGAVNALLITRLRLIPFVVTLATLYFGRGFALWLTETRAMNLPDSFLAIGASRVAGVPVPVLIFLVVVAVAYLILGYTPFGRQVFAVGQDAKAARKAGIPVARILAAVHVISGVCAAIGAIVALAQP